MKHTILLAATILTGSLALAQKPIDLSGNWKEMRRLDTKGVAVAYTDTFRINFMIGNEFIWQQKGSFQFKGTYKATKTQLDLGSRVFTVLRTNARQLVLKDENGTYELQNYTPAQVKEDNSAAASSTRGNVDETNATIHTEEMTGGWDAYKRTSSVQLKEINYHRVIKKVIFNQQKKSITGIVIPAQNDAQSANWIIERYDNGTLYCSGPDKRQLQVKKCADGELIIQEETMTYFFKRAK